MVGVLEISTDTKCFLRMLKLDICCIWVCFYVGFVVTYLILFIFGSININKV